MYFRKNDVDQAREDLIRGVEKLPGLYWDGRDDFIKRSDVRKLIEGMVLVEMDPTSTAWIFALVGWIAAIIGVWV